jgi:hypothetical protein
MSEDERLENELLTALNNVATMPWPQRREKIFRNVCLRIMVAMGWETISTTDIKEQKVGG